MCLSEHFAKTDEIQKQFLKILLLNLYLNLVTIQVRTVDLDPEAKLFLNSLIGLTILVKERHLVQIQPESSVSLTSVKYSLSALMDHPHKFHEITLIWFLTVEVV